MESTPPVQTRGRERRGTVRNARVFVWAASCGLFWQCHGYLPYGRVRGLDGMGRDSKVPTNQAALRTPRLYVWYLHTVCQSSYITSYLPSCKITWRISYRITDNVSRIYDISGKTRCAPYPNTLHYAAREAAVARQTALQERSNRPLACAIHKSAAFVCVAHTGTASPWFNFFGGRFLVTYEQLLPTRTENYQSCYSFAAPTRAFAKGNGIKAIDELRNQ
jgi:hypothetical protein